MPDKGVEFVIFCLQGFGQPQKAGVTFISRPIFWCKAKTMKRLIFILFVLITIACVAQNTTYYDQYGNKIGTSTTTGNNNIFGGSAVRSNSQPIPPIPYDALREGYAAREAETQKRRSDLKVTIQVLKEFVDELNKCNHNLAQQYWDNITANVSNLSNNDVYENYYNIKAFLDKNGYALAQAINDYCK